MSCEVCGEEKETVRLRMIPVELGEPMYLCADCWADVQEIKTPERLKP